MTLIKNFRFSFVQVATQLVFKFVKCMYFLSRKPDLLLNSNKIPTPQHSPQQRSLESHSSSHHKEKRHSFTGLATPHHSSTNHNRHSAEILSSDGQVLNTCNLNIRLFIKQVFLHSGSCYAHTTNRKKP